MHNLAKKDVVTVVSIHQPKEDYLGKDRVEVKEKVCMLQAIIHSVMQQTLEEQALQ
jgi:hypothetical protein